MSMSSKSLSHDASRRGMPIGRWYARAMNLFLDSSIPLAVRIPSAVMFFAMYAALSWALMLLVEGTGHPYRVLFVGGIVWSLNRMMAVRERARSRHESRPRLRRRAGSP